MAPGTIGPSAGTTRFHCGFVEIFMEFGFDHVHFLVRDVRALTSYFQDVFGLDLTHYDEDFKGAPYANFRLGEGSLRIRGLREGNVPDALTPELVEGLDHVGFVVRNVGETTAWLEGRGAEVSLPPRNNGIGGRGIAFIRGPGNIRIELCEPPRSDGQKV